MKTPLNISKERYKSYLSNIYIKKDGTRFKSQDRYVACISKGLEFIKIDENLFYSANNTMFQFKLWKTKLEDALSHAIKGKDEKKKKYAIDYICALDSFLNFVDHQRGNS